jgi:hypothetical protein
VATDLARPPLIEQLVIPSPRAAARRRARVERRGVVVRIKRSDPVLHVCRWLAAVGLTLAIWLGALVVG